MGVRWGRVVLAVLGIGFGSAAAQEVVLSQDVVTTFDQLGRSVAVDGARLVAGAPGYDSGGFGNAGAAFVFARSAGTWAQEAVLAPFGPALDAGDNFGQAVAISGDRVAVGAYNDEDGALAATGSAYVFTRDPGTGAWSGVRILPGDVQANSYFGYAVDLDGDDLIVGAYNYDVSPAENNAGAVYIFHFDGGSWVQQAKLLAPVADQVSTQRFGYAVAIDGDMALIGAYGPNGGSGKAYYVRRNLGVWSTPVEMPRAGGPPYPANAGYGLAVALDLPSAAVGANAYPSPPAGTGAVHLYRWDAGTGTWSETGPLVEADLEALSYFGTALAAHGDWVLVGASEDDVASLNAAGSVLMYHFTGGAWTLARRVTTGTPTAGARFGVAVGFDGVNGVVGGHGTASWRGAASVFPAADLPVGLQSLDVR